VFYLDLYPANPPGFHALSTSADWLPWLIRAVPAGIHLDVRRRLNSNLKHIMVGLEMKAGLIVPHGERVSGRSVLFEPYFQIMNFEFSVGVFSVCEGLGSVHHLAGIGDDGTTGARVNTNDWIAALCREFDPTGAAQLEANVRRVKEVRDKMHQDRLGARADIDWHDFDYNESFIPSRAALQPLLRRHLGDVSGQTNLLLA
jgi:hypothetical protein